VRPAFLLLIFANTGLAQLQLNVVENGVERVAPSLYDVGSIYPTETVTANFRLRNLSAGPAQVTTLTIAGAGFMLSGPVVPRNLAPQGSLDFAVSFHSVDIGTYSAALRTDTGTNLLTATVVPRLTLTGSFDFGTTLRGTAVQQTFTIVNETAQVLIVPAISVQGADFSLFGLPPSGEAYTAHQGGTFAVIFTPRATGPSQGKLVFGDRTYTLTGAGADPPLPKPFLTIDLKQVASAQQGTVIIRFDMPAKSAGTGTLTLEFRGPADPTVSFASGGRAATFNVVPGDTQASMSFQTGTTAGTLVFTAQLGGATDQLRLTIPNAPAGVSGTQGQRAPSSVQVDVTGFDNTRTLNALTFTFYDSTGSVLPSGSVQSNAAAEFTRHFARSDLGGAFVLRAVFPVTGDITRIAACDVTLTNAAGSTKAPRISF
jgi:hypothetical protein